MRLFRDNKLFLGVEGIHEEEQSVLLKSFIRILSLGRKTRQKCSGGCCLLTRAEGGGLTKLPCLLVWLWGSKGAELIIPNLLNV